MTDDRDGIRNEILVFLALGREPMLRPISERTDVPVDEVSRLVLECREQVPSEEEQRSRGFSPPLRFGGYRLERFLGRGTMGRVYLARGPDGRERALKVIIPSPELAAARPVERFLRREAPVLQRLSRKPATRELGIVRLHEAGDWRGLYYCATEYLPGGTLKEEIARRRAARAGDPGPGPLHWEELLAWVRNAAALTEGLARVHDEGVLHRDIKPANIFLDADGGMKLGDFGMAAIQDVGDWDTIVGTFGAEETLDCVGTPLYWPPELVDPRFGEPGPRSDVYSLGLVLYESLTLLVPYRGADRLHSLVHWPELRQKITGEYPRRLRSVDRRMPAELEHVLFRAIEKRPERRYGTAAEMAAELRRFARREPVRVSRGAWARRWAEGHRAAVRVARGAVLLTATALLVLVALPALWAFARDALDERAAARLLAEARERSPEEAIPRLRELIETHPGSSSVAAAWDLLGTSHLALDRREAAQTAWIQAFARDPRGADGVDALLHLVRSFHEEGALRQAARLLGRIHRAPMETELRARFLLRGAEIAAARAEAGEAKWHLDELAPIAEVLGPADRERHARLRAVLAAMFPVRELPVPPAESRVLATVGTFRPGRRSLAVLTADRRTLFEVEDGRIVSREVRVEGMSGDAGSCAAGDLDGDGVDELLLQVNPGGGTLGPPGELRIYRAEPGGFSLARRYEVPRASYCYEFADYDGDGRTDLVLGTSWPQRWMVVMRNRGGLELERVDPGEMAEIRESNTDVRQVEVGDLTGDGRAEIVVSTDAYGEFSLFVYRFEDGTFRRVFRRRAGFVFSGMLADADADGRPEVVYALEATFQRSCLERFGGFDPQGVYLLDYDPTEGVFRHRPLWTSARLDPDIDASPPPPSFGYRVHGVDDVEGLGPCAFIERSFHRGNRPRSRSRLLLPLAGGAAGGVALSGGPVHRIFVADLDGNGSRELWELRRGSLRAYGLGGEVESKPPAPRRPGRAPETLPVELEVANTLRDIEHHDAACEAFRRAWRVHRGTPHGRAAIRGLVSSCADRGRFDDCLRALDEYAAAYPEDVALQEFWRARYRRKSWDVTGAARAYAGVLELGGLSEEDMSTARRTSRRLAGWTVPWREGAGPGRDWLVREPGHCRLTEEGGFLFGDARGGRARALLPVVWRGGSFQLAFELRVDRLEHSHCLVVGLARDEPERRIPHGLVFTMAHSSTAPRCPAVIWDHGGPGRAAGGTRRRLPLGAWMTVTLTHLGELDRCGIRVEDPSTGETLFVNEVEGLGPAGDGPHYLTIGFAGEQETAAEFRVRDPVLTAPSGSEVRFAAPGDRPDLAYLRANAALARGEAAAALRDYERCLSGPAAEGRPRELAILARGLLRFRESGDPGALAEVRREIGDLEDLLKGRVHLLREGERERLLGARAGGGK